MPKPKIHFFQKTTPKKEAETINATNVIVTSVSIEFVIAKSIQNFSLQDLLIKLFNQIKNVDSSLKVLIGNGTKKWDKFKDIPAGTKFETNFVGTSSTSNKGMSKAKAE
eukprot:4688797-Ditylum_brightwellii.AAC.1